MQKAAQKVQQEVRRTPSAGDRVAVTYSTNGDGKVVGIANADVATIKHVYLDGSVCVGNGDVYQITPNKTKKDAVWMTVRPRQDKRD